MNNTRKFGFHLLSALMIISMAAFVTSCSDDVSQVTPTAQASVSSEASTDSYFEDVESIASSVSIASDADLGGRMASLDDRFCANAKVTLMRKNDANSDTVKVEFIGDGCTVNGITRKGTITIIFAPGQRKALLGEIKTILNLTINGVKIEGTRTVVLKTFSYENGIGEIKHEITLEGGKISWPDGTYAERESHHFRKAVFSVTPGNNTVTLLAEGGNASGKNRNGKDYEMTITKDIVFKASCTADKKFLPVEGEKVILVNGKTISVNYGDGTCDNIITITINGESKEVTVDRDNG